MDRTVFFQYQAQLQRGKGKFMFRPLTFKWQNKTYFSLGKGHLWLVSNYKIMCDTCHTPSEQFCTTERKKKYSQLKGNFQQTSRHSYNESGFMDLMNVFNTQYTQEQRGRETYYKTDLE